jgi:hypothetical protein
VSPSWISTSGTCSVASSELIIFPGCRCDRLPTTACLGHPKGLSRHRRRSMLKCSARSSRGRCCPITGCNPPRRRHGGKPCHQPRPSGHDNLGPRDHRPLRRHSTRGTGCSTGPGVQSATGLTCRLGRGRAALIFEAVRTRRPRGSDGRHANAPKTPSEKFSPDSVPKWSRYQPGELSREPIVLRVGNLGRLA